VLLGISLTLPRVKHGEGLLRRTSRYASGRLTVSAAWQEVAPYSSRRHSQGFENPPKLDFEDSTCICLPARSPTLQGEGRGIFEQPEK